MAQTDQDRIAAQSGSFRIGGELEVNRLGFGAMRLTGEGIWGEPDDPAECRRVLEVAIERASTSSTPRTPTGPRSPSA